MRLQEPSSKQGIVVVEGVAVGVWAEEEGRTEAAERVFRRFNRIEKRTPM